MSRGTVILLGLLFCSVSVRADRVITRDATTLEGQVSFHRNGVVRVTTTDQPPRELPLSNIDSLRILTPAPQPEGEPTTLALLANQITNRFVAVPGAGVLTWEGSFLATAIDRIDDTQLTPRVPAEGLVLTRINTSVVFFQPLSYHHVDRLRRASQGVLLRNGDFIEGRILSVEEKTVRIVSLIFGTRNYSTDEAVAVLLRPPSTPRSICTVQTRDGSRFLLPALATEGTDLLLDHSPFHGYRVPLQEIVELIRRPGTNLLQSVWDRLDLATASQKRELLERVEIPDLAKEAAEANLVRTRNIWDDTRRVWANKSRDYNEAKSRHDSARKNAESKQRQADNAIRQLHGSEQDLAKRAAKVSEAEASLQSSRDTLDRIGRDVQARAQVERKVQEATRALESAQRSLSQARSRLTRARDKHEAALADSAAAAAKADQLQTIETATRKELERAQQETDAAKQAFDQAMARVL